MRTNATNHRGTIEPQILLISSDVYKQIRTSHLTNTFTPFLQQHMQHYGLFKNTFSPPCSPGTSHQPLGPLAPPWRGPWLRKPLWRRPCPAAGTPPPRCGGNAAAPTANLQATKAFPTLVSGENRWAWRCLEWVLLWVRSTFSMNILYSELLFALNLPDCHTHFRHQLQIHPKNISQNLQTSDFIPIRTRFKHP